MKTSQPPALSVELPCVVYKILFFSFAAFSVSHFVSLSVGLGRWAIIAAFTVQKRFMSTLFRWKPFNL
jgi:hypothetical protein